MTSYRIEHTSPHGTPGAEFVQQLLDAAQATSGEPADALAVVSYVEDAQIDAEVVAAAALLSKEDVALALDQPRGIVLIDLWALRALIEKYPTIVKPPSQLTFEFQDLCEALLFGGHRVWNITIERSGTLGYYQRLKKRPWHRPGKRWWQIDFRQQSS